MVPSERAGAILTVDLGALAENWRRLAARSAPAQCGAVVKANAYGLGIEQCAPALWAAGARLFFVAHLEEGIALRAVLPGAEIFILHGPFPGTEADFRAHRLTPVLNDFGQLEGWARGGGAAALHLDSGLNRLGLGTRELDLLAHEPQRLADVEVTAILSHLVIAEDPGNPTNEAQRARFAASLRDLPPARASLANSSGIFLGPHFHFDFVRAGAALYGVNPTPGAPNPMREVARLQGKVLSVRDIGGGEHVGYGAAYTARRPRRIATVATGYADGYLRALGNRAMAGLAGRLVPVVGRVSMDLITLDVTDADEKEARPGALVDLLGGAAPIDEVAAAGGSIAYELLTRLGPRFHRVYRG
jgi:alanine racemase